MFPRIPPLLNWNHARKLRCKVVMHYLVFLIKLFSFDDKSFMFFSRWKICHDNIWCSKFCRPRYERILLSLYFYSRFKFIFHYFLLWQVSLSASFLIGTYQYTWLSGKGYWLVNFSLTKSQRFRPASDQSLHVRRLWASFGV